MRISLEFLEYKDAGVYRGVFSESFGKKVTLLLVTSYDMLGVKVEHKSLQMRDTSSN